ncbi:MAG: hypothetical protein MUP55_03650 [Candidatus Aenigmarchaeota archaeon]|nr:hypothetical protein [Candidatus Aenigmarchaeota archaeon]
MYVWPMLIDLVHNRVGAKGFMLPHVPIAIDILSGDINEDHEEVYEEGRQ